VEECGSGSIQKYITKNECFLLQDVAGTTGRGEGGETEGQSSLSACSAPTADTIVSARAAALSVSVSSTSCAIRAQLERSRANSELSCEKRPNKRAAAALKSCTMSGAGGGKLVIVRPEVDEQHRDGRARVRRR